MTWTDWAQRDPTSARSSWYEKDIGQDSMDRPTSRSGASVSSTRPSRSPISAAGTGTWPPAW